MDLVIYDSQTDRRTVVNTPGSISVQELAEAMVDKLHLRRYDPEHLRYLKYFLKLTDDEKELDPERSVEEQLHNGDQLIIFAVGIENPISNSEYGVATLRVSGSWSVKEFNQFLQTLRNAYLASFGINEILLDRTSLRDEYNYGGLDRRHELIISNISAKEELRIHRIKISSPGIVEIIGALNPLETIRKFLQDHRQARLEERKLSTEEKKDKDYRIAAEKAKAVLEIESLRTRVVKEKADLLRDVGFSQEQIRPYIREQLEKPLEELVSYQDQGKLTSVSVVSLKIQPIEVIQDNTSEELAEGRILMLPSPDDYDRGNDKIVNINEEQGTL